MPRMNEYKPKIFIIFILSKPVYLKTCSSFLSIRLIKNNWVLNKKTKGSISNKTEGVFNKDKKKRYEKLKSIFLKNSICSRIFVIKIIIKKTIKIFNNEILKRLIRNLI